MARRKTVNKPVTLVTIQQATDDKLVEVLNNVETKREAEADEYQQRILDAFITTIEHELDERMHEGVIGLYAEYDLKYEEQAEEAVI